MVFSKEHLTGVYTWAPSGDVAAFEGQPSRRLFDRWNGDQVFYIIDLVLQSNGDLSIEQGKKLERMIINKLPFDQCSEVTVFNWLQKQIVVNA